MEDVSGKFLLVVLRADQVRVHHKKTKHEYRFQVSGNPPEVGACGFHPNPATSLDPRDYRDDAKAAAEWFIVNRSTSRAPVLARANSGWISV